MWTMRGALLLALGVSAALLADYSTTTPAFCSVGSGCDTVRRSGLGYIPLPGSGAYLSVPVLGLIGFGLAFTATLLPSWQNRRRWSLGLLCAGAFVAVGLILAQAVWIGDFCSLCVAVDLATLVACGAAFLLGADGWRAATEAELRPTGKRRELRPIGWGLLAALAVAAPWSWPKLKPAPPVPPKVAAFYQPGKINVVEFADFECPYCRRLHGELKELIAEYDGKVNFVRLQMPLERHENARPAARAAICAAKQGHGEPMADWLFVTETLDPASIAKHAKQLGLNLPAFQQCSSAKETEMLIDQQASILREAGFQGLPTTYVGGTKIVGAQAEEVFRDAFDRAAKGTASQGVPGFVYWPLVAVLAAAMVWFGRTRRTSGASELRAA
jgi:protein-disulfide isomerase